MQIAVFFNTWSKKQTFHKDFNVFKHGLE